MPTEPLLQFEVSEYFLHDEPERSRTLQRIIDRYLILRLTADDLSRRDEGCSAPFTPD